MRVKARFLDQEKAGLSTQGLHLRVIPSQAPGFSLGDPQMSVCGGLGSLVSLKETPYSSSTGTLEEWRWWVTVSPLPASPWPHVAFCAQVQASCS